MSEGTSCKIQCACGGYAQELPPDAVYYVLTAEKTIIFRGICNRCGEGIRVERPILSLLDHCPLGPQRVH